MDCRVSASKNPEEVELFPSSLSWLGEAEVKE